MSDFFGNDAEVVNPSSLVARSGPIPPHRLRRGNLVAAILAAAIAEVAVAMPAVLNGLFQSDLATTSTQLTWISAAFLVPVTMLELSFGVLGSIFGCKRLLIVGASLMTAGAAISFFTPGPEVSQVLRVGILITGTVVTGIGAAAVFPASIAMLAAGTRTIRERARSVSLWSAGLLTATLISPIIGGILAGVPHPSGSDGSWRWSFLALGALAVASAIYTAAKAQETPLQKNVGLDWPGQITIALALFFLVYGIIQGSSDGYSSVWPLTAFGLAIVLGVVFVIVERRSAQPLVDLGLFSNRVFAVSAIITILAAFSYLGSAYSTSIRLAVIQGYSPLMTALGFVCLNIAGLALFPVSSRLLERQRPSVILGLGAAFTAAGDIALTFIPATITPIWTIALPLVLVGAGFQLSLTAVTVIAVNSVPMSKAGIASGITSMLRDLGLTLGPAIISSVALSRAADQIARTVAASPTLTAAMKTFQNAPAQAPADQRSQLQAAVDAVNSGPLGANGVPSAVQLPDGSMMPLNPIKHVAFQALSDSYSLGYLLCGLAAIVAGVLAVTLLRARLVATSEDVQEAA